MLENEPDTNETPNNGDQPTTAAAPPRRRRAASRPAGPPATAADAPTIEKAPAVAQLDQPPVAPPVQATPQVETTAPDAQQNEVAAPPTQPQIEVPAADVPAAEVATAEAAPAGTRPARKAAAKRPARKATAKKATATPDEAGNETPPPTSGDDAVVEAPKKRAPRKRTAKKVADPDSATESAPAQQADDSGQISVGVSVTSDETASAPAGWEAPSVTTEPSVTADAEPTAPVEPVATAITEVVESDVVPPAAESVVIESSTEPDRDAGDPEALDPEASDPEALDPEALDPEALDPEAPVPEAVEPEAVESPRDFGWLADPFAAPRAPRAADVPQTDDSTVTDAAAESAEDDSTSDDGDDAGSSEDDDSGEGGSRRRRRRRGGRRRRRGGDFDSSDDSTDSDDDEDETPERGARAAKDKSSDGDAKADSVTETSNDDSGDESDGDDSQGQGRRRRRRRRRGEETAALPDDPAEVVVRVREPRARKKAAVSDEPTGIQGSTRMEAKRQRRKEGRDAGRRRAPILSEAEFLARRESVSRKMVIRQRADLTQIAVLEDGILVEHYVDRDSAASLIGNVYLGRVQNVLPSMEAAFVDIGRGRNAVLYAGEVDWDSFGAEGHNRKVEKVLKSGQMILVQVSKDPVGAKGARLTNHVSIPGRYVVYAPGGHLSGISRKLPDVERRRLKDILADLVGSNASVIVRTAAEGASEEGLVRDVNRLKAQWEDIERKVKAGNSPQLLYGEPDLTVRIVRDLFTEDFSELVIQGNGSMNDAYDAIQGYVTHVAPHLQERIHRWEPEGDVDLFSEYRLDEQIAKALERKVFLPSGGSLVIDRTEAMTVIDVNTGKFTGTGGNLEATVTSNNLEAAEEIVNQLRLRDIGGIIVIDFIDMVLPANRELLLRRLVECLGRDRTRHQVAEVTSLGLVQMTRKKIGTGLLEAFGTECPTCHGRGYELHDLPVDTQQQADGGTREQRPQGRRQHPNDGPKPGAGTRGDNSRNDRGSGSDRSGRGDSGRGESVGSESSQSGGGSPETEQVEVSTPTPSRNRGRNGHASEPAQEETGQQETGHDAERSVEAASTDDSMTVVAVADSGAEAAPEVGVDTTAPVETADEAVVFEVGAVDDQSAEVVEAAEEPAVESSPVHRGLGTPDPAAPETSGARSGRQHNDSVHDVPLDDEPGSYGGNGDQPDRSRNRRGRRGGRGGGGSGSRDQGNRDQGNGSSRDSESQPAPTS